MRYHLIETTWGPFGYVADGNKLIATYLPQNNKAIHHRIKQAWPDAVETNHLLPRFAQQVIDYFAAKLVRFTVTIEVNKMTPFQQIVLQQCRNIPYGKTASYADLARAAGKPAAARAAGSTMARNPLPLVIPCHRILRSDGSLGGFSTPRGIQLKEKMLRMEHQTAIHFVSQKRTLRAAG